MTFSKYEEMRNLNLKHSKYFDFSQLNSIQSIKMHAVKRKLRHQCACATHSSWSISWSPPHSLSNQVTSRSRVHLEQPALVQGLHRFTTFRTGSSCLRSGFTGGLLGFPTAISQASRFCVNGG